MAACPHKNTVIAPFGDGEVYHCTDCNTYIRPQIVPMPEAPAAPEEPAP